jgi:hypothetical protein
LLIDIHHDVVFPQRKFSDSGIAAGILPRITFLPNPGKVVIQKSKDFQPLLLSLCSEDVLMEMSRLEASKHDSPQDRIQNLFAHLLKQQRYLFQDVNLNMKLLSTLSSTF